MKPLKDQLQKQLEQISNLEQQLSKLQQIITEQQNKENNQQLQEQRENKLDDFLFKSLFKYKRTLDELIEYVSSNGLDYTKEEIIASLNRIRQIVAISDARKISNPRIYEISKPLYTTNSIFEIESNSECIDILLTSDWHITSDNLNGGILIETRYLSKKLDYLIIGIGLNVNQESMPDNIKDIATSLFIETKKKYNKEDIISGLINKIESEE